MRWAGDQAGLQPQLTRRAARPRLLAFYTGSAFPAQFRGGAFVGEHGSWNRPERNGYKVVFIRFENGKPVGQPMDFVTSFVKATAHEAAWWASRPTRPAR
jgi:glucose/arabinose dehydrogenase